MNDLNREEGASIWLTTIPLKDEGYDMSKQEFWDLIRIRYGWFLKRIPETCECGNRFDLNHALSCKKGGFVSVRHNKIRNTTALLLSEVCKDVKLEPTMQPLSGELLESSTNLTEEARCDISARSFRQAGQI